VYFSSGSYLHASGVVFHFLVVAAVSSTLTAVLVLDMLVLVVTIATLIFISLSCTKESKKGLLIAHDYEKLIEAYNSNLPDGNNLGEAVYGKILVEKIEGKVDEKIVFRIWGSRKYRKFQFQYDRGVYDIDIPKEIEKGMIVYLGDNLVVKNLANNEIYYFVVDGYEQRISEIKKCRPCSFEKEIASTKYSALSKRDNCPKFISGTRTFSNFRRISPKFS